MTPEGNDFEREIGQGLRRLADGAPPGPAPGDLSRLLRRRTIRRGLFAGGVAAGILLGLFISWRPGGSVGPGGQGDGPPLMARTVPDPIPPDADPRAVEEALSRYLSSTGAEVVYVEKRPREGASFSLAGSVARNNDELKEDFDSLLQNFDRATLSLRGGKVRYSFALLGR